MQVLRRSGCVISFPFWKFFLASDSSRKKIARRRMILLSAHGFTAGTSCKTEETMTMHQANKQGDNIVDLVKSCLPSAAPRATQAALGEAEMMTKLSQFESRLGVTPTPQATPSQRTAQVLKAVEDAVISSLSSITATAGTSADELKSQVEQRRTALELLDALRDIAATSIPVKVWHIEKDGSFTSRELPGTQPLQQLPEGERIVPPEPLRVWTKGADGDWRSEVVPSKQPPQPLPEGERIVSPEALRVWTRGADGELRSEVIPGKAARIESLQHLPNGRIVPRSDKSEDAK